jgi:hypothetical protein
MQKLIFVVLALSLTLPGMAKGGRASYGGGDSGGSHALASPHAPSRTTTGTGAKSQHEHVSAYTKKDGTRVATHDRSAKDGTKSNNWSAKGNMNPETGKVGTK